MTMDWNQTLGLCAEAINCGEPLLEASARHIEGLTHWFRGAPQDSEAAFDNARTILAELPSDHPPGFNVLLVGLPVVHDFGAPRVVHEETLATFRHCGPRQAEGYLRMAEAQFARFEGDHDRAQELADDAVARFRLLGDRRGSALALGCASCVARSGGNIAAARSLLEESMELRRATGDTRLIGIGVGLEALLEAVAGDPARARTLFAEVEDHFTRQGDTPAMGGVFLNRGAFELAQGEFDSARELLELSAVNGVYQRLIRALAWANIARAEAVAALGDVSQAHALLEEARADMEQLGEPGGLEGCAALEARLQSPLSSS
jgi:tetratricopeptide (TPR) repeat protein